MWGLVHQRWQYFRREGVGYNLVILEGWVKGGHRPDTFEEDATGWDVQ